jgi:hypothetical protein
MELTVSDVTEIADFSLPAIAEAESLMEKHASVTLPSLGVPVSLIQATTLVELGILVSLFYFWLYYAEARRSPRFPADTTLFGALLRTRISRFAFFLLLATPPLTAAILAMKSWWVARENAPIAALVFIVGYLIRAMRSA